MSNIGINREIEGVVSDNVLGLEESWGQVKHPDTEMTKLTHIPVSRTRDEPWTDDGYMNAALLEFSAQIS